MQYNTITLFNTRELTILYLYEPIMPSVLGDKHCNSNVFDLKENWLYLNYNTYPHPTPKKKQQQKTEGIMAYGFVQVENTL